MLLCEAFLQANTPHLLFSIANFPHSNRSDWQIYSALPVIDESWNIHLPQGVYITKIDTWKVSRLFSPKKFTVAGVLDNPGLLSVCTSVTHEQYKYRIRAYILLMSFMLHVIFIRKCIGWNAHFQFIYTLKLFMGKFLPHICLKNPDLSVTV